MDVENSALAPQIIINYILYNVKVENSYNPNSGNVGTFLKIWIKWKLKDFQITWANIFSQ